VAKKEVYRTHILPVVLVCDAEGQTSSNYLICLDTIVATLSNYVFICPHHENDSSHNFLLYEKQLVTIVCRF